MSSKARAQIDFYVTRDGTDGAAIEYVYIRTLTPYAPTISDNTPYDNKTYLDDGFRPGAYANGSFLGRCTTTPTGVDDTYLYEWVISRQKGAPSAAGERAWPQYSGTMKLWAHYGDSSRDVFLSPAVINMDDSYHLTGYATIRGDVEDQEGRRGEYTLDLTKFYSCFGTTIRVFSGKTDVTYYSVIKSITPLDGNIATLNHALMEDRAGLTVLGYYHRIDFTSFTTSEVAPLGYFDVEVEVVDNDFCSGFTQTERVYWFIGQNAKRDTAIANMDFWEEDGSGNIKLKNIYGGVWTNGFVAAGGVNSSSDTRLKDNVACIQKPIDTIMSLIPREWIWNEKHYLNGQKGAGLVAQEVEKVLPFAVSNDTEYLSLNYNVFHAYEIAAIQELVKEVKELKAKVEQLKMR